MILAPVRTLFAWAGTVPPAPGAQDAPVTLSPIVLLGGVGMMVVAAAALLYARGRKLSWRYIGWGAIAWVVSVTIKFAVAATANQPLLSALVGSLGVTGGEGVFDVYVGLLTGVFEVALVYLFLRITRYGYTGWRDALAFGIGFGAVEAFVLGLNSTVTMAAVLAQPQAVGQDVLQGIIAQSGPLWGLATIWERFFTILVHIFCNVLIFYALVSAQSRWFWLSFVYKTALDAMASWAQFWGLSTLGRVWTIEAAIAVFGLVAWWGTRRVIARYPPQAGELAAPSGAGAPPS